MKILSGMYGSRIEIENIGMLSFSYYNSPFVPSLSYMYVANISIVVSVFRVLSTCTYAVMH